MGEQVYRVEFTGGSSTKLLLRMMDKWGPGLMRSDSPFCDFIEFAYTKTSPVAQANKTAGKRSSAAFSGFFSLQQLSFHACTPSPGHMARLCRATFSFQGRLVIRSRWHAATCHPLGANEKRRRCTQVLNSESPLVHRTQTTEPCRTADGPGQENSGSRTNLPANRWLPRSHTATPPASHFGAERAAHRGVGEGARVEEEMIVIEYEMSITWNEHTMQVGRGSEDGFSDLGDKLR